MDANHKPELRGTDNAIWSRIKLVPFTVSIPKEERDSKLGAKLRAELPGILKWAVEGCLKWQKEGLGEPVAMARAVDQYRREMDLVADFIADCCNLDPNAREPFSELYAAFSDWCGQHRERPMSHKSFAQILQGKGYEEGRTSGGRFRKGLALKSGMVGDQRQVPTMKPAGPLEGFQAA